MLMNLLDRARMVANLGHRLDDLLNCHGVHVIDNCRTVGCEIDRVGNYAGHTAQLVLNSTLTACSSHPYIHELNRFSLHARGRYR